MENTIRKHYEIAIANKRKIEPLTAQKLHIIMELHGYTVSLRFVKRIFRELEEERIGSENSASKVG